MPKLKSKPLIERTNYRNESNKRLQEILEKIQLADDPAERKRLEDAAVAEFYSDAENPAPKPARHPLSTSGSEGRGSKNSRERSHRAKQLVGK
jgi:hypothetical protein